MEVMEEAVERMWLPSPVAILGGWGECLHEVFWPIICCSFIIICYCLGYVQSILQWLHSVNFFERLKPFNGT